MLAATLALAAVAALDAGARAVLPGGAWIAAGAALVFLVGLRDDVRPLGAGSKLGFEAVAALLVMSGGLLIERVTVLGVTWHLGVLAWPVTLVWIVGLTNAFNLIDGLDGLASGVAVIAGTTCAAILVLRGHPAEAMLIVAVAGAALGFLAFNFNPASIFLGDSGSLVVGFLLATTALAGWQKGATVLAAGVPLLIFALPIADTAAALVRRARRGGHGVSARALLRRVVEPDRAHIHHHLLALGWSVKRAVLLLYAVSLGLSLLALATARIEP